MFDWFLNTSLLQIPKFAKFEWLQKSFQCALLGSNLIFHSILSSMSSSTYGSAISGKIRLRASKISNLNFFLSLIPVFILKIRMINRFLLATLLIKESYNLAKTFGI